MPIKWNMPDSMKKVSRMAGILKSRRAPGLETDTRFQAETAHSIVPGMKPGQFQTRQQFRQHMQRDDVKRYFHTPYWKNTEKSVKQIRKVLKGEEQLTT